MPFDKKQSLTVYICVALGVFCMMYFYIPSIIRIDFTSCSFPIFLAGAITVHFFKALRLYIILLGYGISFRQFLHIYARTTFVNLIFPFKSGEFFRGYYIGNQVNSYFNGYMITIADRFADTCALISCVVAACTLGYMKFSNIYVFFTLFLILILMAYWLFEPLYDYWNHFLIIKKGTKKRLNALKALEILKKAFLRLKSVIGGRFIILYILSVFAWTSETVMLHSVFGGQLGGMSIYLNEIMTDESITENIVYVVASITVFAIIEIVALIIPKVKSVNL